MTTEQSPLSEAELVAKRLHDFVGSLGVHGPEPRPWDDRSEEHKQLWRNAVAEVRRSRTGGAVPVAAVRPSYGEIIAIVNDCSERMKRSGESHRMFAKWVSEGINAALASPPTPIPAAEPAGTPVVTEGMVEAAKSVIVEPTTGMTLENVIVSWGGYTDKDTHNIVRVALEAALAFSKGAQNG